MARHVARMVEMRGG